MCRHGPGWTLKCSYLCLYLFKFTDDYTSPNTYLIMQVFALSWVFF